MTVPDYQSLMLPVLRAVADGNEHRLADVRRLLAEHLGLTDEDLALRIRSGAPVFDNRVHWAVTYMVQAGLLRRTKRAVVELTERGREVLAEEPSSVDNVLLSRYPEFLEFKMRARERQQDVPTGAATTPAPHSTSSGTPREQLADAVEEANAAVAAELLNRIRDREPTFLEQLVLQLLTAMGYGGRAGAAEHLGRSGDQGLDGVIRQDALGLDRVYVQAKRYGADHPVGRPEIQAFVGALHGAQADRGVFITTSRFTDDARDYADRVPARLVLIDGLRLTALMVLHNVGVQDEQTFTIKRVDEDFFEPA
ncbi:restriction endonuclease [Plantactinospora solaniradicis]|uniref:Restriction endonuclease n=1 Tax=Plantactinospora solaniradicis TaxID=1723736 RepID=A0ABW1KB05_9ACTN